MSSAQLKAALNAVKWSDNVSSSLEEEGSVERLDKACGRIAVWARQIEQFDKGNPAVPFVRGLQVCSHHVVACACLGLYRAAASSIRGTVENGLYYTYFRLHPSELATLVRDGSYYVSRADVIDFHKLHTPDFRELQNKVGLLGRLDEWYKHISSIVHGQIPGEWVEHVSLQDIKPESKALGVVVDSFELGEAILHDLLLITVGRAHWDDFSSKAKGALLSGISGDFKTSLGLDKA